MPAEAFARDTSSSMKKHASERVAAKRIPVPLYAPNLLGYARIILAFVGLCYAMIPITTSSFSGGPTGSSELESAYPGQGAGRAVQIWILSASLDLLDGPLARRLDQCSKFGVLLDILADNVLRSATWIATAVTAVTVAVKVSTSVTVTSEDRAAYMHSIAIALIACGLVCLEWTTMLCTQLKSVADGKHWKLHNGSNQTSNGGSKSSSSAGRALYLDDPPVPALVTAIFRNNFRSPLGILSMYGMFSAGLWTYGSYFVRLREALPLFEMWWALAVLGRVLSLRVEIWLCWSYLRIVLAADADERRRRDDEDDKCR